MNSWLTRIEGPIARLVVGVATTLAAAGLIAYRVGIAISVGPGWDGWDTYAFVANAAEFAGKGYGYLEPHRPPAMSWIVSIVYRFTEPSLSAIQWVDGAFALLCVIGMYVLLSRRFSVPLSAVGSLALLAVAPFWSWIGVGYTDIASIALSVWLIWSLEKATEDHPAWFVLSGVLYVSAVMTRFTALLIAFSCVVWLIQRGSFFRHARWIAGGVAAGLALYAPAALYYQRLFGEALFPFVVALGISDEVAVTGTEAAKGTVGFYVSQVPSYLLGERSLLLAAAVLIIVVGALATGAYGWMRENRPNMRLLIGVPLLILGVAMAQVGSGMAVRIVSLMLGVIGVWRVFAPSDPDGRVSVASAMDAVMLTWLLTYLDFHGHQDILVPRYFITMTVPLVYFVIRGWALAAEKIAAAVTLPHRQPQRAPLYLTTALLAGVVGFALLMSVPATPREPDSVVVSARDSAAWLAAQPDAEKAAVISDVWPMTAWYLRAPVEPMPSFETSSAYAHKLRSSGAARYVTIRARRYDGFDEAWSGGGATVLERATTSSDSLPRILYLGKSWDNYLEELVDYDLQLVSTAGRYGWEGTAFLDAADTEPLEDYDAVALFALKWRDRMVGEHALERYVRDGGAVVLDASANLDGLAYSLGDSIMFDALVQHGGVQTAEQIHLNADFAARHELETRIAAAEFVDEGGGTWNGAHYSARPGSEQLQVIASVGDRPLVSVRTVGRGRVYLVGYNLAWHAFLKDSDAEAQLVKAVFDDAVAHSRATRQSASRD